MHVSKFWTMLQLILAFFLGHSALERQQVDGNAVGMPVRLGQSEQFASGPYMEVLIAQALVLTPTHSCG